MLAAYLLLVATIPTLLLAHPPETPYLFAILFGVSMGADYMLIPLVATEQFGVNMLARVMAVILPASTIAQTWFPYLLSLIRDDFGNYQLAMNLLFVIGILSALLTALLPRRANLGCSLQPTRREAQRSSR